jgi:novobiocin biosynthesis protein NovU/D-mycarose 3-C-methyltransferase
MFRDYLYVSGTSETIPAHFAEYAQDIQNRFVPDGGLVVEIGSNDGTLLRAFDRTKGHVLGVEPARNIAAAANDAGIPTMPDFFGEVIARRVLEEHGPAAAIIGNNVVAHIDDLHDLLRGVRALLHPHGVFVAEFPYLVQLLERRAYDTIYHEHLSYFSVESVSRLSAEHGLKLFDVRQTSVHGGSIRVFVASTGEPSAVVSELIAQERSMNLAEGAPLAEFAADVVRQRDRLREVVLGVKKVRPLAGYGAPAKGNTLLNYCGIDSSLLDFIVDRSPLKQGLLTPGTHIPVEAPRRLVESGVKDTLLLAWNFADEVLRQQQEYRSAGGRFIVPIPTPRVV